ncbi:hypothetical protein AAFG13_37260 [Bradyrhizobium sp. B124]|uniref:hypothetical protein n=1 Tax=Bradyrhizobium sp. B124 TaxID=3140245 RepID=UPI003183EBEE
MMVEIMHLERESMEFSQFFRNAGGQYTQCRPVVPDIGATLGATIATYDGCSIEWTTKYEQAAIVLEGVLRIRTGDDFARVIEARPGDVLWFRKGTRLKYEGEKARAFFAIYPADYRINIANTLVDAAAKHFQDVGVQGELIRGTRADTWTSYEVKAFLDRVFTESGNAKVHVKSLRIPRRWLSTVGAAEDSVHEETFGGVPLALASDDDIEIVFQRS